MTSTRASLGAVALSFFARFSAAERGCDRDGVQLMSVEDSSRRSGSPGLGSQRVVNTPFERIRHQKKSRTLACEEAYGYRSACIRGQGKRRGDNSMVGWRCRRRQYYDGGGHEEGVKAGRCNDKPANSTDGKLGKVAIFFAS